MERKNLITFFIGILMGCSLLACQSNASEQTQTEKADMPVVPAFCADSSYAFIKAQTDFGARVPNSEAHRLCGDYLVATLERYGAQVINQYAKLRAYDGTLLNARNIIASWNPVSQNRLFFCAHWDSRHICDEDTTVSNRNQPVMGANDGASGVAVLLEVARLVSLQQPHVGLDIILFDAEDYGHGDVENSFCLGSQYWAMNPHVRPYNAKFGILLDMVGGKNPVFAKDQVSMHFAADIANFVWDRAAQLGHGNVFVPTQGGGIIDDHYYVNLLAKIPCIDIIHYREGVGFPDTWHTTNDVLENIDKNTLYAVGNVITHILYESR